MTMREFEVEIECIWKPREVELIRLNNKGRWFFSRRDGEGAVGLDFFSQKLFSENTHFCFPPPSSLVLANRHFERYEVSAVMVVPIWPSSTFFSTFFPDGKHAAQFVTKMRRLQPIFICGPLVKSNGMRGRKCYITAVLEVDFRRGVFRRENQEEEFCVHGGCNVCLL